jgi:hypothetical protein
MRQSFVFIGQAAFSAGRDVAKFCFRAGSVARWRAGRNGANPAIRVDYEITKGVRQPPGNQGAFPWWCRDVEPAQRINRSGA